MRVGLLSFASVLVGAALGAGVTWAKFGARRLEDESSVFSHGGSTQRLTPPPEGGPQPKAVVESDDFDFGSVEPDSLSRHVFHIKNDGKYPLRLRSAGTTCMRCTVSDLPKTQLAPGEEGEVTIEYHASSSGKDFRQSAIILTNDLQRPRITLTVHGTIVPSFRVLPDSLVFSSVPVSESRTAKLRLLAYTTDKLEVLNHELLDRETASYFDVQITSLAAGELDDPAAKSGLSVAVTIKPGLPLGPIRQKIRLVTNLPRASVLEVPIEGAIQSDISVVGPGWKSEQGVLSLGTVSHTQGIKRTLMLLVHGPHRQDVRFSVGKVVPSLLRVQIGESRQIGSGAVVQVPLEIEIPPGSPPVSYLSASQSKLAEIVLETTHPEAKQLRLWVQFAIER